MCETIREATMFSPKRARLGLLFVWFLFVSVPGSAQGAKLYVVYASISGTQAITWVARESGIFAKHGLDVELLFTGGGRAITSLLGGDTPLITVGGPSVIAARLAGSDAIITAHIFDTILYSLIVQPDIKTLADLKGKKIGASRFGSATDFALRYVLKQNGFDPLKDVVIFQIGGQSETLAALKAGSINGGVIASPAPPKRSDSECASSSIWETSALNIRKRRSPPPSVFCAAIGKPCCVSRAPT